MNGVAPYVRHAPVIAASPLVLDSPDSGERQSLQIELNRRLYMDEATLEPNSHYSRLGADLERLVAAVAAHVRESIGKTT